PGGPGRGAAAGRRRGPCGPPVSFLELVGPSPQGASRALARSTTERSKPRNPEVYTLGTKPTSSAEQRCGSSKDNCTLSGCAGPVQAIRSGPLRVIWAKYDWGQPP